MRINKISAKKEIKERSNFIYLETGFYYLIIILVLSGISVSLYSNMTYYIRFVFSVLGIIVIGWCQFSLSNALHEALHKNFGRKHNELLAAVLTAYPIGFTMLYRNIHMDHHKYFGDNDKDPDFPGYSCFPKTKLDLTKRLIYNLMGFAAVKQFLFNSRVENQNNSKLESFRLIFIQIFILCVFITFFWKKHVLAGLFMYIFFWILPLVTIAKFCSSTRLLCEHGSPEGRLLYRTITGNLFQTFWLGAFKFNYHGEHHIVPYIPYTQLKKAKNIIKGDTKTETIAYEEYPHGYVRLLINWFKMLPLR